MKRVFSVALVFVLCALMCACTKMDNANPQTVKPDQDIEISNTVVEQVTAEEEEKPEGYSAKPIKIGETISLDYASFKLDAFEISDGYEFEYVDDSKENFTFINRVSLDCPTGMKLVSLVGKFTNKSKVEVYPGNRAVDGKLVINGYEYKLEMNCYNAAEAKPIMGLAPLAEVDCYITAEVPETLVNTIESCQLYVGFVKDLAAGVRVESIDEYDALFLLDQKPTTAK